MNDDADVDDEILEGRAVSREEEYYLSWFDDSPRRNFTVVNDVLGKLIVLAPALAGGAALMNDAVVHPVARPLAVVAFLASLAFALAGLLPQEEQVAYHPTAIKTSKERMLGVKKFRLWAAVACLFLGFLIFLGGFFGRQVDPPPPPPVSAK